MDGTIDTPTDIETGATTETATEGWTRIFLLPYVNGNVVMTDIGIEARKDLGDDMKTQETVRLIVSVLRAGGNVKMIGDAGNESLLLGMNVLRDVTKVEIRGEETIEALAIGMDLMTETVTVAHHLVAEVGEESVCYYTMDSCFFVKDIYERRPYGGRSPSPPRRRYDRSPMRDRPIDRSFRPPPRGYSPPPRDYSPSRRRLDEVRSYGSDRSPRKRTRSPSPRRPRSPSSPGSVRDRTVRRRRTRSPSPVPPTRQLDRPSSPHEKEKERIEVSSLKVADASPMHPPSQPNRPSHVTTNENEKGSTRSQNSPLPQTQIARTPQHIPSPIIPGNTEKSTSGVSIPQDTAALNPPPPQEKAREPDGLTEITEMIQSFDYILRPTLPSPNPENLREQGHPYLTKLDLEESEDDFRNFQSVSVQSNKSTFIRKEKSSNPCFHIFNQKMGNYKSLLSQHKLFYKKYTEYERGEVEISRLIAELELAEIECRGVELRSKTTRELLLEIQNAPLELPYSMISAS